MARNFCILVLLLGIIKGEQFSFWAKFESIDHKLVYDEIYISPLMLKLKKRSKFLCKFKATKKNDIKTYDFLLKHKDDLFECFVKTNVKMQDSYISERGLGRSKTNISLLPIKFEVGFDTNFTIISTFED